MMITAHLLISLSFPTIFCMSSLECIKDLVLSSIFDCFLISFSLFSLHCSQVFPTFGQSLVRVHRSAFKIVFIQEEGGRPWEDVWSDSVPT